MTSILTEGGHAEKGLLDYKISPQEWELFWLNLIFSDVDLWRWRVEYFNHEIMDGTQWEIKLHHAGFSRTIYGANAYPECNDNELVRGSPFHLLVERINKLLRNEQFFEFDVIDEDREDDDAIELAIRSLQKAFYDTLKSLVIKYDFTYPEDKLLELSKAVRLIVEDKVQCTDWSKRDDIKAELKVGLIMVLAEFEYPPVDRDEVYREIFEQAENFKKYQEA